MIIAQIRKVDGRIQARRTTSEGWTSLDPKESIQLNDPRSKILHSKSGVIRVAKVADLQVNEIAVGVVYSVHHNGIVETNVDGEEQE